MQPDKMLATVFMRVNLYKIIIHVFFNRVLVKNFIRTILLVLFFCLHGCFLYPHGENLKKPNCASDINGVNLIYSILSPEEKYAAYTPNSVEIIADSGIDDYRLNNITLQSLYDGIEVATPFFNPQKVNDDSGIMYNSYGKKYAYFDAYDDALHGEYCIRAYYVKRSKSGEIIEEKKISVIILKDK